MKLQWKDFKLSDDKWAMPHSEGICGACGGRALLVIADTGERIHPNCFKDNDE